MRCSSACCRFPVSIMSRDAVHHADRLGDADCRQLVGALFAAFSFAITAFSLPMLLDKRVDAFTAMGTSMALVWNNLPVMLVWGAIVLALFLVCLATGLLGLIVVFPLLGHANLARLSGDRARRAMSDGGGPAASRRGAAGQPSARRRPQPDDLSSRASIAAAASRGSSAAGRAAGGRTGTRQSVDPARGDHLARRARRRSARDARRARLRGPSPRCGAEAKDATLARLVRALAVAGFAAEQHHDAVGRGLVGRRAGRATCSTGSPPRSRYPRWPIRGRIFFRSAWQALRHGRTNMDVPISIGVLLAFGMSLYDTIHHGAARLFRCLGLAAVLPADRPHARPPDARARADGGEGLARLAARGATVRRRRHAAYLPVDEIVPGMTVLLAAGERVPVDARRARRPLGHRCLAGLRRKRARPVGAGTGCTPARSTSPAR